MSVTTPDATTIPMTAENIISDIPVMSSYMPTMVSLHAVDDIYRYWFSNNEFLKDIHSIYFSNNRNAHDNGYGLLGTCQLTLGTWLFGDYYLFGILNSALYSIWLFIFKVVAGYLTSATSHFPAFPPPPLGTFVLLKIFTFGILPFVQNSDEPFLTRSRVFPGSRRPLAPHCIIHNDLGVSEVDPELI